MTCGAAGNRKGKEKEKGRTEGREGGRRDVDYYNIVIPPPLDSEISCACKYTNR